MLLLRIGFNRKLISQLLFGGILNETTLCRDEKGKSISSNVARDTIRSYLIECLNKNTLVYTVTQCSDSVRYTDNHNVNSRNFVKDMIKKSWHFQDIYLDHFRMPDSYMTNMLKDGFFKNLVLMGK